MNTINKEFLEKYRFSDQPNAWLLEAEGFRHSAELLMQGIQNQPRPKFVSMLESNRNHLCLKNVCFLYAISIELFLKAIYSASKTSEDKETTESFNHNLEKLYSKLLAKGVFEEMELNKKTLNLAHIILAWFGRYYKPLASRTEEVINTCFEKVPGDPLLLKAKFTIRLETAENLKLMATLLSNKMPANPGSVEALFFLPF